MNRIFAAAFAVLISFAALPAVAATTGFVRGNIVVNNKPEANVNVRLQGEGSLLSAKTDASGNYVFSQVPFGNYTLSASYPGVTEKKLQVQVSSDEVLTINFALGSLKVISTASATARAGASGTPVSVNTLTRAQLAALPTNNSLNRVVQTVPGIVRFSYNEPVAHGFHGLTYEIDGAPMPQGTTSNFAEIIDPKNVDSVEVFTGAFPAEYGGSRMGALVNIQTNRLADLQRPQQGYFTIGGGNYGQAQSTLTEALKLGSSSELFFNANAQHTDRGLDTPTYQPIHDNSSQSDQFLRYVTNLGQGQSLAFDFSNQFAQFQVPINTDPNSAIDPQFSPAGTDDVQREYDRFANLNFTRVSKDGNGVFQFIPWVRSTRVAYEGDLNNDVQSILNGDDGPQYLAGLQQDQRATYAGVRISQFRASAHHAIKVGIDLQRENYTDNELIAAPANAAPPDPALPYTPFTTNVAQAGSEIGIYAQDKWSPSKVLSVNYGLRYDHSTGFTSGFQFSPRIGVNIAPDGKNVVHFYYGRMYAAPSLEDVRRDCVVLQGCATTPIYDLKPEQDAYYEMGVAHTFSSTLSGYVNYFKRTSVNVLDTTQLLNTPLFAVFNNARGRDEGFEARLDGRVPGGDNWFVSGTYSVAEAAGVSGSTFLFPPDDLSNNSFEPEDHDQTWEANGGYTHRFGDGRAWFATLQGEYGTGFPVEFESGVERLPAHLTIDASIGKEPGRNGSGSLGFDLTVENLLNHQYIIKIANGFNTTQIAPGRSVLFRVTAPF
jgi:outer membrane receptor protein involved in Fe transport